MLSVILQGEAYWMSLSHCLDRGRELNKGQRMENISRDPTFGDFVSILIEGSMQDITVARLQSTRVQTPLSPSI
jgi:hypothetical protein